jgi:hypothetical protein
MQLEQDETFHVNVDALKPSPLEARVNRQAAGQAVHSTLNIASPAFRIEVEDAFFNHDSAVMMPDTVLNRGQATTKSFHAADPEFMARLERFHPEIHRSFTTDPPDPPGRGPRNASGLGVLAAVYRFLGKNPSFRLLLAGHCDTSGEDDYNFKLSELRARSVLALLEGDRESWVKIALEHSRVEDQKRICQHAARERGWPCDPGKIDNESNDRLRTALRAFRENFNRDFDRSIAVDGPAGRETWGAFFDTYMDEIAELLDVDVDGLDSQRGQLQFVQDDQRFIACGERLPIEQKGRDGLKSEQNRRVELLFFSMKALPDLHCHAGTRPFCMRACVQGECGVYSPNLFAFVPIEPSLVGVFRPSPRGAFEIVDIDADLEKLADKPDEHYRTEVRVHDVDASMDPWAFLAPFQDLEPQHSLHETSRRGVAIEPTGGEG